MFAFFFLSQKGLKTMDNNRMTVPLIDAEDTINEAMSDLSTLIVNSVVTRQIKDLFFHYPNWPKDAPKKFLYKPPSQPQAQQQKLKGENVPKQRSEGNWSNFIESFFNYPYFIKELRMVKALRCKRK